MAPAICDGETAKVKICANGTLIQVGPENSTHPGDIIVYCAAVAGAVSESMFACGRAVYKWFKDGEWWFKTQMDSSAEPDKWWVPEHALLGVVVEVIRGVSSGRETNAGASGLPGPVNDLITGIAIGVVVGALGAIGNSHSREDTQYLISEGSEPDDRISPLQLGFSSLHQLVKREDGRNWNQRV